MRRPAPFRTALLLLALPASPMWAMSEGPSPAPPVAVQAEPRDTPLPLQRVTLYSSGVGYFEHAGPITAGDAPTFRFTDAQLNDVLKSLLVRGTAGPVAVAYPGQEPVEQRLAGFGIDLSSATSLEQVVAQLRGVELNLTRSGSSTVTGTLIGVNPRTRIDDDVETTEHLLTLATNDGLQRITLDQVNAVAINDETLNAELQKALVLLGSTRKRDAKPLTLNFAESSEQVAVSYLLETPLWKLTYRLDLSQDEPLLQAWAVVDNTTDTDWEDIHISLVSGRPVSFVQNLYAPEYLQRPVIRPERFAGLRPQTHALASGRIQADSAARSQSVSSQQRQQAAQLRRQAETLRQSGRFDEAAGLMNQADFIDPHGAIALQRRGVEIRASSGAVPATAMANTFDALGAELAPAAAAADLGSLFAYHLDERVTLRRGESAMLPILNADIKVGPVSVYNPATHAKHPMLGASVRNTTDLKLDAGPITVLDDGAYAGDAQLGFLAPGDARLITYGLDLEVTVDATQQNQTELVTAKVSNGTLELTHATQYTHTYEARNAAGNERQLLLEHPRIASRELIQPQAADPSDSTVEKTDTHYRFPLSVEAGETATLKVVERQPRLQRVQLISQNADQLAVHVRNGEMPEEVRVALAEAVRMQRAIEDSSRQIEELDQRVRGISDEQSRIRNNMQRLDRNNALYQRYVEKLDAQETQLENIGLAAEQLREQRDAQRKELNTYLEKLDVG